MTSQIMIIRKASPIASSIPLSIYIDNQLVATLWNDKNRSLYHKSIKSGNYEIQARMDEFTSNLLSVEIMEKYRHIFVISTPRPGIRKLFSLYNPSTFFDISEERKDRI